MCENNTPCFNRNSFLAFVIPFFIGGIWFSLIGLAYLDTLPAQIVGTCDRLYVVFVAFLDMGCAFGIASFTILCFFRQMRNLIARLREEEPVRAE
jgi:hypothetical protein